MANSKNFQLSFFEESKCVQNERKIKDTKLNNDETCSICFNHLTENPEENESNLENEILVKTFSRTPCNHDFHQSCLTKWMDLKLVCPFCREKLPPIDD